MFINIYNYISIKYIDILCVYIYIYIYIVLCTGKICQATCLRLQKDKLSRRHLKKISRTLLYINSVKCYCILSKKIYKECI